MELFGSRSKWCFAFCLASMICATYIISTYISVHSNSLTTSLKPITWAFDTGISKIKPKVYDSAQIRHNPYRPVKFVQNKIQTLDYRQEMEKLNQAKVDQGDQRLIQLIRDYYIVPPSEQPYHLANPNATDYSIGQAPFVDSRLNYKEGGFYIECGAHNGERGSNTLFFEKFRKWNGILIEADPSNFQNLKSTNRKAFLLNACLNTEPYPAMKTFNMASNMGRIAENEIEKEWIKTKHIKRKETSVQCFPLYSILRALDELNVDFFSLDIEGDELPVLKTIPWDKVNITMMTVEVAHGKEGAGSLRNYVLGRGYDDVLKLSRWDGRANDIIFKKKVRKSL